MPITKNHRTDRRTRAEKMIAAYQALPLEEKIMRLPEKGAHKQRMRLSALLEKDPEAQKRYAALMFPSE